MIKKLDRILNFIGACIRWAYGYLFKITFGQENFTFHEFLNGSPNKNDVVGRIGHRNVNLFFGALVVMPLIIATISFVSYHGLQLYKFAEGVRKDAERIEGYKIPKEIILDDSTIVLTGPSKFSKTSAGDTLHLAEKCAMLIIPDSDEIEELKFEYGEENFYTSADDNMWYIAEARSYLDSMGIKTIDTDKNHILFNKADGQQFYFETGLDYLAWGLIFFDSKNDPKIVDLTDVRNEYAKFYGN